MLQLFKRCSVFVVLICTTSNVFAQDISIADAFIRAMPPTMNSTAAYMIIRNTGENPTELIGAYTPIAASSMLHETVNENGLMHMNHLMAVTILPGEEIRLSPGGLHLMLMGVKDMPAEGEEVELTLRFRDGKDIPLTATVKKDI